MKHRLTILLGALVVAFSLYVVRHVANIPTERLGQDAVDFVTLHGNVSSGTALSPGGVIRPGDVTGVYLFEGSVNPTMIAHLRHLPKLEAITIGPDYRVRVGTPLPLLTDAATTERTKMQEAFPSLIVRLAVPSSL